MLKTSSLGIYQMWSEIYVTSKLRNLPRLSIQLRINMVFSERKFPRKNAKIFVRISQTFSLNFADIFLLNFRFFNLAKISIFSRNRSKGNFAKSENFAFFVNEQKAKKWEIFVHWFPLFAETPNHTLGSK